MFKKVLIIAVLLSLISFLGCTSSSTETTKSPASVKSIREATITSQWKIMQVEINMQADVSIMLDLATGDKVDGYFYVEDGDGISFAIYGNSLIYQSQGTNSKVTSDRFSFSASQAQGIAYTLKLAPISTNSQGKGNSTVFLELIYPVTGQIFVPFGTK
jgi:hypothetical protein